MRKLKITVALLVMLFVCHAVFAAFVPVDKADKALVDRLGAYCDMLQNLEIRTNDPIGSYLNLANMPDDSIEVFIDLFFGDGPYESLTDVDTLKAIFPRGVEEAGKYDEFRRVAIHLAAYTAKNGSLHKGEPAIGQAEAQYSLVGYDYLFRYDGEKFIFKFVDAVGDEELEQIVTYLAIVIPGADAWDYPTAGEIDIYAAGLTQFGFDSAVRFIEAMIYSTIY